MRKTQQRFRILISLIGFTLLLISLTGCENQEKGQALKSTTIEDKNKDFIQAYTEDFWNKHNLAAYEKYYSAEFIVHSAGKDQNFEQYKGLCQAYFTAFPDLRIATDYLVAEGDKVAKVWTATCTHKEEFMGIPATGKQIVVKGIEIFRIKDGKIAELWVSMDNLGMMQQLGVIPPMGK
jgi:steroid delta-isomerase-like uncharacterized protein